ncbi:MAG: hypothetical protein HYV27_03585 [Candidatus Hydrogenedentes bacterium]|nr:hypothetical protein [Candidatus Hydrogenedentota bacterium]
MLVSLLFPLISNGASNIAYLDVKQDWRLEAVGPWKARSDHRALLAMHHPWSASEAGNFSLAWRTITIPESWQEPIFLSFYQSDDYHGVKPDPDAGTLEAQGFIGHRFKRVLVDNEVIWNRDVADAVAPGTPAMECVALPVHPGQRFRLGLLVFDDTPSTVLLPEDYYRHPDFGTSRENDASAYSFRTSVFWGDLTLHTGDVTPSPEGRPSQQRMAAAHRERWPAPEPEGKAAPDKVRFRLDLGGPRLEPGFPLHMGIPLPEGAVSDPGDIRFQTAEGKAIYTQKRVLNTWRDGTVRWLQVDMAAPNGDVAVLAFARDEARAPGGMEAEASPTGVRVKSAGISYEAPLGNFPHTLQYRNVPRFSELRVRAVVQGESLEAVPSVVQAQEDGPFSTTVLLEGTLEASMRSYGQFSLALTSFDGMPWLKGNFRLINTENDALAVSSLALLLPFATPPGVLRVGAGEVELPCTIEQRDAGAATVNGEPVADTLVVPAWEHGAVVIRNFAPLYPKRITINKEALEVDVVAGGSVPVIFTPGEAKTHEIWLALDRVDPVAFGKSVQSPPLLINAAYVAGTSAVGPAATVAAMPAIMGPLTAQYAGKSWQDLGFESGLRHFPGTRHLAQPDSWANNYNDRLGSLLAAWLLSGDRAWFDRACDLAGHVLDVVYIHADVPGNDWAGAMHGPGQNHVGPPWNPALRTSGLALYYSLTGDTAARDALLGTAEFCRRTKAGLRHLGSRHHAGPMDAIYNAYDQSEEPVWLDEGTARIQAMLGIADMRRGVWSEVFGSESYRAGVPWMSMQLAEPLYRWYMETGDVQAAQLLVALAEGFICEQIAWDDPAQAAYYSPAPRQEAKPEFALQVLPALFAAHELTGDTFFLDAAKQQWDAWCQTGTWHTALELFWQTPWLCAYLEKHGLSAEAEGPVVETNP